MAGRTLTNSYDIRGNLAAKTSSVLADVDVTAYGYAPGKNRLTSATVEGVATSFSYDANGNVEHYDRATGDDKYLAFNARNLPTRVTIGCSLNDTAPTARDDFAYGPDGLDTTRTGTTPTWTGTFAEQRKPCCSQ